MEVVVLEVLEEEEEEEEEEEGRIIFSGNGDICT